MSTKEHTFTLGIEEEFAIIDPETRELRSHIQEILEGGKVVLKEQIKPEMHQSVVELGTEVCNSIEHARGHVIELRSRLAELAGKAGLKIASVGTHPFSHWRDQHITEGERYKQIIEDMQLLARANLIFGLHVHVGIPNREMAIHVMNQARYFLPHLYALSVNSPFWVGEDTGLKGYRLKVFERFPRTGIPDSFESLSEYDDYCKLLVKTGCIDNAKKIWWDIRLHPFFDTLEVRVCDAQTRVDDTLAIAALIQAVIAKLFKLLWRNTTFRIYRRRLLDENRWHAARYGAHRAHHARRHRRRSTTCRLETHPRHESRSRSYRRRNLRRVKHVATGSDTLNLCKSGRHERYKCVISRFQSVPSVTWTSPFGR